MCSMATRASACAITSTPAMSPTPTSCPWRWSASSPCWTAISWTATRLRSCLTGAPRRWPARSLSSWPESDGSRLYLGTRRPPSRARDSEKLVACSSAQPRARAAAEPLVLHGIEYLCVAEYSSSFAGEQLHSLTTALSKALQNVRCLSVELSQSRAHFEERGLRNGIACWLSAGFLGELVRCKRLALGSVYRMK